MPAWLGRSYRGTGVRAMRNVVVKAIWLALVVVALILMIRGLWATFYFEPTAEAIAEERRGELLVFVACGILVVAAVLAARFLSAPGWATAALVAPVVICGGLVVVPVVIPL